MTTDVDQDDETAESLRLRAIDAVLSANITATTPIITEKAFEAAGIIFVNDKVRLNPWAMAKHFAGSQDELFTVGLFPPVRTALYSCVFNTPSLIDYITTAKSDDVTTAKSGWVSVRNYYDDLDAKEFEQFDKDPDHRLPWDSSVVVPSPVCGFINTMVILWVFLKKCFFFLTSYQIISYDIII